MGLSDACSYDVIGRVDRFGFQNFCSPGLDFLDFNLDTVSKQQKTRQNFTGMVFLDFSLDTVSKQQKNSLRQNFTDMDFLDFSLDNVSKKQGKTSLAWTF